VFTVWSYKVEVAQCLVNAEADQASVFASKVEFADLIGADNKRLVEIWNSLPGVKASRASERPPTTRPPLKRP
jgi:hypothetical protein